MLASKKTYLTLAFFVSGLIVFGYFALNFIFISDGFKDPVFALTGVTRTQQLAGFLGVFFVSFLFLFGKHTFETLRGLTPDQNVSAVWICAVFALLFLNFLNISGGAIVREVHNSHWGPIFSWALANLFVQSILFWLIIRKFNNIWTGSFLVACLVTFNLYALGLGFINKFIYSPVWAQAFLLFVIFLLVWVFFAIIKSGLIPAKSVAIVLLAMGLTPLVSGLVSIAPDKSVSGPALVDFQKVNLRDKPNIHIVSFDALSPGAVIEKQLGLLELPYITHVQEADGLILRNAFAGPHTIKSLNKTMTLSHPEFQVHDDYFSGQLAGPLSAILKNNGYLIANGYPDRFLGTQGPFVDIYHPSPNYGRVNSALCNLLTFDPIRFFGYCSFVEKKPEVSDHYRWKTLSLEFLEHTLKNHSDQPIFSYQHFTRPIGHRPYGNYFDEKESLSYTETYRRGSIDTAQMMKEFTQIIKADPRPSIIIFKGDHGTQASKHAGIEEGVEYVHTQYGIFLAVAHNMSACSTDEFVYFSKTYSTPARLMAGIIRCLSQSQNETTSLMRFKEDVAFEDYLYE